MERSDGMKRLVLVSFLVILLIGLSSPYSVVAAHFQVVDASNNVVVYLVPHADDEV